MKEILSLADGLFYPRKKEELTSLIEKVLEEAPEPEMPADAIVTPHAAYKFCIPHMASSFKSLQNKNPSRIIILAPLHRECENEIFLPEGDLFATPFGKIHIDTRAVEELGNAPLIKKWEVPFLEEPAVELQLPFISYLFPHVPVLPVFSNCRTVKVKKALASVLASLKNTELIITSNLTEFRPWQESAREAKDFIDDVEKKEPLFNPESWDRERKGGLSRPCGIGLLSAWWRFSSVEYQNGTQKMKILSWGPDKPEKEMTSGDKAGYYGGFALYNNFSERPK